MWIVRLALQRKYTIAVLALLILILGVVSIRQMPTDIFPRINIPVISVIWTYRGLSTDEMEKMITNFSETSVINNASDIQRVESQTYNGVAVLKIFFQPTVKIEEALAAITGISQTIRVRMPPGTQPPIIVRYNATDVPIIQLSISSDSLTESQITDYITTRIRPMISTVPGSRLSQPFGGKARQVMVDLDPELLTARGVSPEDVVNAVSGQNLTLPSGQLRLEDREYNVRLNTKPDAIIALNDIPVKTLPGGVVIHLRDVANVHDGSIVQTNIVKQDGLRGVLLNIVKTGNASTTEVVDKIRNEVLPAVRGAAPASLRITELFDQSVFVRASIHGVVVEGLIAALLTAAMILLFLGSWRSTLIVAISIPLSILCSLSVLYLMGETLNINTLGGLALAIGILVDDATVTIENIHRNEELGLPLRKAIMVGAQQIATPTLVATLTICIVFVSVLFLEGPARFLFGPLALSVVFAMIASYILSRTLVPTLADLLLKHEPHHAADYQQNGQARRPNLFARMYQSFNRGFDRFQGRYLNVLQWNLKHRKSVLVVFLLVVGVTAAMIPFVGRDFFPSVDAGQFKLHMRAPAGSRLEATERTASEVEKVIRSIIPKEEIETVISNIGLTSESYNMVFQDNSSLGSADSEILVALKKEKSHPTDYYTRAIRAKLAEAMPEVTFFFQPADIVTQILNFGLTSPIDIQVMGFDRKNNLRIAKEIQAKVAEIPGTVDVHLHQVMNSPELYVNIDRERANQLGLNESKVASNMMISMSGTTQVNPNFWPDPVTGFPYLIAVQTPPYKLNSIDKLMQTPLVTQTGELTPQSLANVAKIERRVTPMVVNRLNTQPMYDVYASVERTDLGSVSSKLESIVKEYQSQLKPGNKIEVRGQVESMNSAFVRLGIGLIFAAVLVYMLMVVNFQSFLYPFIIITALPGAMCGVVWLLFLTQTTFSIPSLMGAIMSVGVATANSILLVSFAQEQVFDLHFTPYEAAVEAGRTRLRPILMTALAMIIGMLPMSLGLGEGGEQNAPLGRAVIGGLLLATFTTLLFVPVVFSYLAKNRTEAELAEEKELAEMEV
ncbi:MULTISPECIES: efflux RND transporter permease subunit [unclassified Siphonobacter]|uniref:efflux RND transporter permease subunit n=1 Tax=unclassified Siphonobacter TaxID=2635712 RepID=UPI000CB73D4D|nr:MULTISPECIES: efflux RND transporter permease subunit [unclassified Siphonobacter]MDQ1086123.1 multidrug efflux pump subunit AcrB [Siphonobacter sp. SORGH_AS_1065]MDR6196448.1 multidrug efflux pump subunit AcrB [Siphonobacter sp. SORGH_AS_0500]PKK35214.1 RND transporter [Siphonobacter sp. SORGH_AS_0500]